MELSPHEDIISLEVVTKINTTVYVSLPFNFYSSDTKSKVEFKTGEYLFIELNYDILKIQHDETRVCRNYSNVDSDSYDNCKLNRATKIITQALNCTLPFVDDIKYSFCEGDLIKEALSLYSSSMYYLKDSECPVPCTNLYASFGFPFIDSSDKDLAKMRMYFKTIVKVTEDYISYDILRYKLKSSYQSLEYVAV